MNPIPGDPEQRYWAYAQPEDAQMRGLRSCLVTFMAYGPDRQALDLGSGFIIAGDETAAVVVTAKHVIEYAARVQRPHPRANVSSPFAIAPTPSAEPDKLTAIWMGDKSATALSVAWIEYNEVLDVALCIVTLPPLQSNTFAPVSIPIDTRRIEIGQQVTTVSCRITDTTELQAPFDSSGIGQILKIENHAELRTGVVTAIHPRGHRACRWPCFTTSIPIEPGMSGGFVYLPRPGETIAAAGILCADFSEEAARSDLTLCGESVVALGWTALGLRMPEGIPITPETRLQHLRDMMIAGAIPMAIGGVEHVTISERDVPGEYSINCRP